MKKKIAIVDVPAGSVRTLLELLPDEVVLTGNSLPCMANSLRLIFDVTASEIGGGRHGYEQFRAQLPTPVSVGGLRAALAPTRVTGDLRTPWSTDSTTDALDMIEDVSARARAMELSLVAYPVHEVEQICAALRAVRRQRPTTLTPSQASREDEL